MLKATYAKDTYHGINLFYFTGGKFLKTIDQDLFQAVEKVDIPKVKRALKQGADGNPRNLGRPNQRFCRGRFQGNSAFPFYDIFRKTREYPPFSEHRYSLSPGYSIFRNPSDPRRGHGDMRSPCGNGCSP